MPAYWLIKSEPDEFSWQQLKTDKRTDWTGVRNYGARNNLRDMRKGDLAFFYHSNKGQEIVGIAKVTGENFPDPTTDNPAWVAVTFAPLQELASPVSLKALKQLPDFASMDLVRQGRLSVGKVSAEEFSAICQMGGVTINAAGVPK